MNEITPEPTVQDPDEVKKKNRKDFWTGVGLWFLLNLVMWIVLGFISSLVSSAQYSPNTPEFLSSILQGLSILLLFLPFAVNIGVIVYFATRQRKQIALGMLGGFGIAIGLVICAGLVLMTVCFTGLSA